MANLDALTPRQKEQLTKHSELALLSKELATIDCKVPLPSPDSLSYSEPKADKVAAFLKELEFNSLLRRFGGEVEPESQVKEPEGVVITTLAQYQKLVGN